MNNLRTEIQKKKEIYKKIKEIVKEIKLKEKKF